ncbi:MAG: hypothetical protein NZ929_06560 [Aigarchaeota archaeon]|nr:hypothetical protein [Aigarchaeota archaeon]MDW7986605.1 choice-of-anchor R domain-containing protein [Nitrososphaerota archaeon]
MTELVIITDKRGRYFRWVGGGIYRTYLSPVTGGVSDSLDDIILSPTSTTDAPIYSSTSRRAQQFITPNKNNLALKDVSLRLQRYGSPTGTLYVELWSDSGDLPSSKIADIGSISVPTISTSYTYYTFTPSSTISLSPNTKYWIVATYTGGDTANYVLWRRSTTDLNTSYYTATFTTSWTREVNDFDITIRFMFTNITYSLNMDFIYAGTGERRLKDTGTKTNVNLTDVRVNGQSVGTSLEETDQIPQSNSYTITYYFTPTANSYSLGVSIQRYLYYAATSITLDNLYCSEAYIQKIKYGPSGGLLRIDDSPDSDIIGAPNETIIFQDILVPFRKLEWVTGSGEVEILGVE